MYAEPTGIVIDVSKQWWLKVNTKPLRKHALDGAVFPHIIKAKYTVDGKEYIKRKWIGAGIDVPFIGAPVKVTYLQSKPSKATIIL